MPMTAMPRKLLLSQPLRSVPTIGRIDFNPDSLDAKLLSRKQRGAAAQKRVAANRVLPYARQLDTATGKLYGKRRWMQPVIAL